MEHDGIKVTLERNGTRHIHRLAPESNMDALRAAIAARLELAQLRLSWTDTDGDRIAIETQGDLDEVCTLCVFYWGAWVLELLLSVASLLDLIDPRSTMHCFAFRKYIHTYIHIHTHNTHTQQHKMTYTNVQRGSA